MFIYIIGQIYFFPRILLKKYFWKYLLSKEIFLTKLEKKFFEEKTLLEFFV